MRRTDVEKTKEILRLHDELGLSQREIAAATGCSLGTVSSTLSKAKAADITYPVEMTAKQLGSALYPPKDGAGEEKHSEPDLENIHREMQRKGVTLTLLWEEYKTAHPDGLMYTQFCQRYRDFRKQNDVYMRKQYKAGERLETDWAGLTLPYGEGQNAYFFVAALPASAHPLFSGDKKCKTSVARFPGFRPWPWWLAQVCCLRWPAPSRVLTGRTSPSNGWCPSRRAAPWT